MLALLQDEPGAEVVEAAADGAAMSAVNWSEVWQSALARGADVAGLRGDVEALGLRIEALGAEDAEAAARLWPVGRREGPSPADRACLALAQTSGAPALTTDRAWATLELGVEVRTIR